MSNITTIGGGTGTYAILSGLKKQRGWDRIAAVVTVTDDGGSTGRLRDEFGSLPVGDFRMALAALADEKGGTLLRDLFQYRFDKGDGLSGHNFGNLFLVAMSDILGSEEKAIEFAARVLNVRGYVIPVSTDRITLAAEYEDGSVVKGEHLIDEPEHDGTKHITRLWVEPDTKVDTHARDTILDSDCIVLGPGDVYTSGLSCVVVPGVSDALQKTKAKLVYVVNLMTKYGQTHGYTASDHVSEIEKYIGRKLDHILINQTPLPEDIIGAYKQKQEYPVEDDLRDDKRVIREDLLSGEKIVRPSGDTLTRSLIRHDSDKLAVVLQKLCQ